MIAYDDHEIIKYLHGLLDADAAKALEAKAAADEELASRIVLIRFWGDAWLRSPDEASLNKTANPANSIFAFVEPSSRSNVAPTGLQAAKSLWAASPGRWKMVAAVFVLLLITVPGALGWAARQTEVNELRTAFAAVEQDRRELANTKKTLEDSLDSGWYDATKWLPPPDAIKDGGVKAEPGFVRLINRGYLVTRSQYKPPVSVSLEWKWIQLGLNPREGDHITVAVRTGGKPTPNRPWEVQDGVLVKFVFWTGEIHIIQQPGWKTLAITKWEAARIPADQWHKLWVADDGESIKVFVTGPLLGDKFADKPVLTAKCAGKFDSHHVAVYNREFANSTPHEMYVRKLVLTETK